MSGDVLTLELLDHIGETVAGGINIRVVDLVRVACEDNLRTFTGTRDNRLDLVWSQVLGLVNDHVLLGYRSSTDVGQRLDFKQPQVDQFLVAAFALAALFHGAQQQFNIVKNRLHPW